MYVIILKSKIHRIKITDKNLNYEGSLTVDADLLERAGFFPYERVEVYNINNGERFSTYVIPGKRGTLECVLNGATARKGELGDLLIVVSFAVVTPEEAKSFKPQVVLLDN
ncbi:MAG TPA: aspartate 1-decarboxylase [Candidatus Hydrothermia bacterium]|nr:aspartate 1-decarboxylase [Candidatus Hydrothermia bacterium]HOL23239.1 aspartate 1-decarboxylase [Candidatus Hydrothermia bacterium]HPO78249.1 aspartate 1-decarboxylase [Candidatus Hydrothermia bacterium]